MITAWTIQWKILKYRFRHFKRSTLIGWWFIRQKLKVMDGLVRHIDRWIIGEWQYFIDYYGEVVNIIINIVNVVHTPTYIMPQILATLYEYILTHTNNCQGYSLLYIHSHIHYAKDTLYYTYTHTYIMPRIIPIIYPLTHILC